MYQVLLAVHIIGIISWMAGILYLLRLFIYHRIETEAVVKQRFEVMEERLYRIITVPAMLVSFVFGVWMLAVNSALLSEAWMHVKLTAVIGLIGVTHASKKIMRSLAENRCEKSEKFLRVFNELPTLLMIIIVVMVIVRPF